MAGEVQWKSLGTLRDGTPRGWETKVGKLRVTVHTHIDNPAGVFVTCHEIGMDRHQIGDAPMTKAIRPVALRSVREYIVGLCNLTIGWDA
jgi:hypothetical protein